MSWRKQLKRLADLAFSNPFSVDRMERERELLGREFLADASAWSRRAGRTAGERPNLAAINTRAEATIRQVASHLSEGGTLTAAERECFGDLAAYVLLYRHLATRSIEDLDDQKLVARVWRDFEADHRNLAAALTEPAASLATAEHLFACLVQVHRAFLNIFDFIVGDSAPIIALRATVWQSIFTCDLRAYRAGLHARLKDIPTLITGPTGTGKELVARAIGQSLYVPFDRVHARFLGGVKESFRPVNLSALSATLIESELFGHRRGSFTGAMADRVGWLEACPEHGAVFLDELGELDISLQVKLLRVTQQRTYSRIGETREQVFRGKLIAATNRDLAQEIRHGRFRQDLFYRLCADQIATPSLAEQFRQQPSDLPALIEYIAAKVAGPEWAEKLAEQTLAWIARQLGNDYNWPGNIRELEQCVRGVMLRGSAADRPVGPSSPEIDWIKGVADCSLSAEHLLARYCTWAYYKLGTFERAAEQLGLDRRTVKARLDSALLDRLRQSAGTETPESRH